MTREMAPAFTPEGGKQTRRADDSTALDVRDLSFSYSGQPVLESVSFDLKAGEFAVLLGPNGAGKTTLFSLITRLYDHRQGEIRIGGLDLRRHSVEAHAQMGVVFQQPTLDMDLTVRQNLSYHGALHGMTPAEALRRASQQLTRLEMQGSLRLRVRHLSGGQRRRVEIARGLLHEPRLLLLDEPTVGLDIASRRALVEHVHRLCREQGVAVLWATHLIDEVYPDDRVIVLHRGRVCADGGVAELVSQTASASIGEAFDRLTEGEAR
ncbi:2-phenylethanol ABC transporter ATP-binding protein [Litchfieldella qijiaojingensis]|uniref:2-phenylethanol ABC transporter ATP-binding protein n=1 Tax=Litchfieldella qijiaojingensis TaxID=980347 RepID=A0ABQ2ZA26_9GAMM|nr:ABC transporter ATP-binding protein [Halomonas qijiaojingensis]GGY06133.1 2-phenylethanol ABC transporter ATP-binding protein [Halomonas qijiaojingensis]